MGWWAFPNGLRRWTRFTALHLFFKRWSPCGAAPCFTAVSWADCWQALAGRKAAVVRQPTQQQFEPLVSAPVVSVNSRVVYILRQLIGGSARKLGQLFSRRQSRSTHVATFLALLELVRGGRVTLGPDGAMTMRRGRLDRTKENE